MGHAIRLTGLYDELARRGHHVMIAPQQIGAIARPAQIWQAPLWPSQLTALARRATVTPATMGDILFALGLGDPGVAAALIGAWDSILGAASADLVVAEFAPALTMAAYGRVPVLALGTGFSLPPPDLPRFPSLTGRPAVRGEGPLLETVNGALQRYGRPARETLPALFRADRELPAVFAELDPYRPWRRSSLGPPSAFVTPRLPKGKGEELFVYMNGRDTRPNALWQGLARSGLRVRIHDPCLSAADAEVLSRAGMVVEPRPVPFVEIAERSRLLLSHGGLGFVCSALLAGLPQVIVPNDIEKRMTAANVQDLGLGHSAALETLDADALAELLRSAFRDGGLAAKTAAAAPGFRARMASGADSEAADAAEGLLP